jgi:antitoxin YefM
MNAITYTAARENIAAAMDQLCADREPGIIARRRKPAVVMVTLVDHNALDETAYLTHSPKSAAR